MIGGIIITHGDFAPGLKNAVEMIAGKQEKLAAVSLKEGDGLVELMERIQIVKQEMNTETTFLFVDLFGATPCNAASVICSQTDDPVIAGVNLALMLEFVVHREGAEKEVLLKGLENCSKIDFKVVRQKDLV